jgi:phosphate transport system protein
MQRHFDEQLQELLQRLVTMGRTAESMVHAATRTLIERNDAPAAEVEKKEEEVNDLQMEVDDRAVKLTALQQPVAADVRALFMASRIASELERIGDQAVNICQNARLLIQAPPLKPLVDLPLMAESAERMVRDSLEALVRKDCDLANRVLEEDQQVDAFKDQIFRVLLTYMMGDPATIQRALALILISRNLERVGDHATNIAEEVIFLVKGRDVRHGHDAEAAGEAKDA